MAVASHIPHPASGIPQLAALNLGLCLALSSAMSRADDDVEEVSIPTYGVVARYESLPDTGGDAVTVVRLETVPRLYGRTGQTPDHRLPGPGFAAHWSAQLLVRFPGPYTFTALRCSLEDLKITLDGQPVTLGEPVKLDRGPAAITVSGTHRQGAPALQLWWRSDLFANEPMDARFFALPGDATAGKAAEAVERQRLVDRGAVLSETMGCARCHRGPDAWSGSLTEGLDALNVLPGPRLDHLGSRLRTAWLIDWMKNPHALRADSRMPALFDGTPADDLAARTIASYLTTGELDDDSRPGIGGDAARGQTLYRAAGCAACHAPQKTPPDNIEMMSAAPALERMAEKWKPGGLASFLQNPLQTRPHGRMPDFGLTAAEAADVAAYLLTGDMAKRAPAAATEPPISVALITAEQLSAQWRDLDPSGELPPGTPDERLEAVAVRQMAVRGCFACHDLDAGERFKIERRMNGPPSAVIAGRRLKMIADAPDLPQWEAAQLKTGCLDPRGKDKSAPRFSLADDERRALAAYTATLRTESSPSMMERTRIDLAVLNCVRCHDNEQHGGQALASLIGKGDANKYFTPPMLTRVGERVRPRRLAQWVTHGARENALRPWIAARMPGFAARGAQLAAALSVRDGALGQAVKTGPTAPEIKVPQINPERLKLGRYLVGTKALMCVNCHSLHGKMPGTQNAEPSIDPTTRSPDLTLVAEHLRPEYFYRWMMNPARIRPDTKMPQSILPNGNVPLRQLAVYPRGTAMTAMWTYLSEGRQAPPPIDAPTIRITATAEQPVMQRGEVAVNEELKFPRAVAAGFVGGTVLFDADQLAVVATWPDGFIKSLGQHYFGLWWLQEGGEADLLRSNPHPLSFKLTPDGSWQTFALPMESDPNTGTRFEGVQVGRSAVRLRYRLLVGKLQIHVSEDVRWESRSAFEGFARQFHFHGLPPGARVAVAMPQGTNLRHFTPSGKPVEDIARAADARATPLITLDRGQETRVARVDVTNGARWIPARDDVPSRVVSPPAGSSGTIAVRVDLWNYLRNESSPAAAELASLVLTPPKLDDDFDRRVRGALSPHESEPIPDAGPGSLIANPSPGYDMESIPLPFADCRLSDVAFGDGMMYVLVLTEGQVWRTPVPPPDQPGRVQWRQYASGLYNPIGMQLIDGRLFVAQKPEITELIDCTGDGVADHFRTVASGWGLSTGWHEYTFGLAADRRKNLWFTLNTGTFWDTPPGYANRGRWRGSVLRYSYATDQIHEVAKGCRVPNGIVCGPGGDIFFTDNQGDWIPSCKLAHVLPDRFFGHPEYEQEVLPEGQYPDGRSAVWMPYNRDRAVGVSGSTSGPVWDGTQGAFGPFEGQLFVGDVGYGANPGIMRIALEKVGGQYQGAVFRFIDNKPHGCLRMKFAPDHQLYMCSLTTGLTRMKFTGQTPLAMHSLNIRPGGRGFVIRLTRPLAERTQLDAANFHVRRYHYLYTGNYGSPEAGSASVPVKRAELASDRLSIKLTLPVETYPIGMVYEINVGRLAGEDGQFMRHSDAWYTVQHLP